MFWFLHNSKENGNERTYQEPVQVIKNEDIFVGTNEFKSWKEKIQQIISQRNSSSLDLDFLNSKLKIFTTTILPIDNSMYEYTVADNIENDTEILKHTVFRDSRRYWTRFKGILENMKSVIKEEFSSDTEDERIIILVIDQFIMMVDSVNVLNTIKKVINPNLMNFLNQKYEKAKEKLLDSSPIGRIVAAFFEQDSLSTDVIYGLAKKLASEYGAKKLKQFTDLTFISDLMKKSGFLENEISQVFQLLDLNRAEEDNQVLPRYGYNINCQGYGHGGMGYGGGGYMTSLDPFVLLAGLAFATFLAFLIFRLLSNPPGKKRSAVDLSLNLDLSDVPNLMSNLTALVEKAEEIYGHEDWVSFILALSIKITLNFK